MLLIISNGTLYYFSKHQSEYLSFSVSIAFVVLACIPAIVSLNVFFIFDFDVCPEENDDEKMSKSFDKKAQVATILSTLSWFFFGTNLMNLVNDFVLKNFIKCLKKYATNNENLLKRLYIL